jgi:hypothetical protein
MVIREWTIKFLLIVTSVVFALLLAEVVTRFVRPISDGRQNVSLDGRPITTLFEPGAVYRQVSTEFDAITTITSKAHRVPGTNGNPDVVFVGDSFTYGWGLADDETFASIYCRLQQRTCANLGRPGTGTIQQVERLEQFLRTWNWRPREVKLFFFGMSSSFSNGNDFRDNYDYVHSRRSDGDPSGTSLAVSEADDAAPRAGLVERVLDSQAFLLGHSNLLRLAKFYWGPMLRSMIVAEPGEGRMDEAVAATRQSLIRLDQLSREYGFDYQIYLIVPVQDIIRHTHGVTLTTLNQIAPRQAISTATLFLDSPGQFFYSFDGHLNAAGSRRIADFLVAHDGERGTPQ